MKWINLFFLLVLGVLFTLVGIHNSGTVEFSYLFGNIKTPLIVVIFGSFVAGSLFALLVFGVKAFFWRCTARALKNQIKEEHAAADEAEIIAEFKADKAVS